MCNSLKSRTPTCTYLFPTLFFCPRNLLCAVKVRKVKGGQWEFEGALQSIFLDPEVWRIEGGKREGVGMEMLSLSPTRQAVIWDFHWGPGISQQLDVATPAANPMK